QEVGDKKNKKPLMEKKQADGDTPTAPHVRNFLDCIKSRKLPVSDIEIGYHSTVLCQLGNIACRTGETIHWDAKGEMAIDSRRANKLLGRKYRSPWNKEVRHLPLTWSQRRMLA
ncbi:hypothetical protein HYR69_06930, partial [Candidatus Sumerlaeota bacterium]|nr:hypothetical protein [Candidatus Sumerlaeota bacterium]